MAVATDTDTDTDTGAASARRADPAWSSRVPSRSRSTAAIDGMLTSVAEDLANTLGRQESAVLELEREAPHLETLRQIVCALANDLTGAGGGDLLIGVDKTGNPSPTPTDDDALLRYLGVRNDGDLLPRPSMVVSVETYAGSPVVRVHVNASDLPPVRLKGVARVRPGPQTGRANATDERVLLERRARAHTTFDARGLAGVPVDALDLELLRSTYLSVAVDPEVVEENDRPVEQQMASLGIAGRTGR